MSTMKNRMKILVVDDSRVTRGLIIGHLENIEGYQFDIAEATNGKEALSSFREFEPDVMLLDYLLPDMNGIDITRELRKEYSILPIVMVTGFDDVQLVVDAMMLGVQGYMLKDRISADSLLWVVEDAYNKTTMQKKIIAQREEMEYFANTVAHNLKDQIGSVQGVLNLLNGEEGHTEQVAQLLGAATIATGQMQDFVQELMSYTALHKEPPLKQSFPLEDMVGEIKLKLRQLIEKSGAAITCEGLPTVYGAYPLIYQVIQNILTNAMSYAGADLTIEVKAEETPQGWQVSIIDDGKGIPEGEQAKIFDMFQRGSTSSEKQGTGIGLATCKRIIEEIHGGEIWVASDINNGTSFCFTLPAEAS